MARPVKKGLDYFPFDVDFFDDDKLQLVGAEFGIKGEMIAVKLLCKIYKNGYYYPWGIDEALLFSKKNNYENNLVVEVVKRLIKRSFFDEQVFNSQQILTSRGIQHRFLEAKVKAKGILLMKEYLLIDLINYSNAHHVVLTGINGEIIPLNPELSTQRKGKENKENESKGEETFLPPLVDDAIAFLKEKIPETSWSEAKCKKEAKAFIDYYAKTGWLTKNGPITNWQNAAGGWITKDGEFAARKKLQSGKTHPDHWSRMWEQQLSFDEMKDYWAHLKTLGFAPKKDANGNVTGWQKI